jgi:predicted TIM-barrel fold metal-dependent hydrolase
MYRFHKRKTLLFVLSISAGLLSCQREAPQTESQATTQENQTTMKYGVPVKAGPMDSILVKDYHPSSSLVVPETSVPKARFPVIDVHSHTDMSGIKTSADVAAWVRTMDEVGVEKTIVFTGATGEEFDRQVDMYLKPYPDRFQLWCDLDTSNIDAPEYPQRAVQELVRCYQKGARGLGELSDKGWGLGGSESNALPRDKRLHIDDPRLDMVWEKCAELKLPVNIHIADHPSCWQPLGPNQERTPDFQVFNLYGKDVPSYEELLASRDRLLAKHPKTTFIFCHLSNQGNDTASLAKVLDRYPNFYIDIAARDYELGREPRTAAKFLARYKGRVMFGTDMGSEAQMYRGWWRLLETGDEFMPGRIWWRYFGLELPASVLKSLYRDTALKVLNWQKIPAT